MCVHVCVCLCAKCSWNIHYRGISQAREWPPRLQTNSIRCLFSNRRWFFRLENRPSPHPTCHSTQPQCLPSIKPFPVSVHQKQQPPPFYFGFLVYTSSPHNKTKGSWKQGPRIIRICILPFLPVPSIALCTKEGLDINFLNQMNEWYFIPFLT